MRTTEVDMRPPHWSSNVTTPAFVMDEAQVARSSYRLRTIADHIGAELLYSLKACPLANVLEIISEYVNGFSASSLFEARLARSIAPHHLLQYVSSALPAADGQTILSLCDRITLNSLGQLRS